MPTSMTQMPQPQVDVRERELIHSVREGDKEAFYGLMLVVFSHNLELLFERRSLLRVSFPPSP
jgi:hypothetical protein